MVGPSNEPPMAANGSETGAIGQQIIAESENTTTCLSSEFLDL